MVLLVGGPLNEPGVPWLVAKGRWRARRWLEANGYQRVLGKGDLWQKQLAQCTVWCRIEQIATVDALPIDILK